jgi:hypothetical protein
MSDQRNMLQNPPEYDGDRYTDYLDSLMYPEDAPQDEAQLVIESTPSFIGRRIGAILLGIALAVGATKVARAHDQVHYDTSADVTHLNKPGMSDLEKEVLVQPIFFNLDFEQRKTADRNRDPKFRASTIAFEVGTGSLIEQDGHLQIATVGHVSSALKRDSEIMFVPGVGYMEISHDQIQKRTTALNSADITSDPTNVISLTDKQEKLLRQKIAQGVITPLQLSTKPLTVGEKYMFANPETGAYITMTFVNEAPTQRSSSTVDPKGTSLEFTIDAYVDPTLGGDGLLSPDEEAAINKAYLARPKEEQTVSEMVCQSFSGSPVVSVKHPDQQIGVLSAIRLAKLDTSLRKCGYITWVSSVGK